MTMTKKDFAKVMEQNRRAQAVFDAEIRALCERIGYGNVMASASRLWALKCDEENTPRSNFMVGPCELLTVKCPHPTLDDNGHCEWCCGTGWLTKRVFEISQSWLLEN